MAIATFYHPELDEADETVILSRSESAHAIKSRRLRAGATISLINGRGLSADAEVVATQSKQLSVRITQLQQHTRPTTRVTIAVAIPKGDRQRFMIEMLTQLGVVEIIPLQCEHSVTTCKQTTPARWSRFAVEACKQSQNPWLPRIRNGHTPGRLIEDCDSVMVYADRVGQRPAKNGQYGSAITACIGPEGGFSPTEIAMFNKAGINAVRLGDYILRTEAAAVAAATLLILG